MRVDRLSTLADAFDGVILDQFGVLHDGHALYPGALDVLRGLQSRRIPVAVVSNSGKRLAANRQRLLDLGIPRETFVDVVTSGEIAWLALRGGAAAAAWPGMVGMTSRPPRACIIGKAGDDYGFEGIPTVDDPREADVLLVLSSNAPHTSLDDYREQLRGLRLPAICCNPDRWMITRHGLLPGPGAIAAIYEELGGQVTWIGKPYRDIYDHAVQLLGGARRVLCVGDSAEHDVAGGRGAGLATLLVLTGVSHGVEPHLVEPRPDYWMEALQW